MSRRTIHCQKMETIRFVCTRVTSTICRSHSLSWPLAGKRAYSNRLYRVISVVASNTVCRCRFVADVVSTPATVNRFPVFNAQHRHVRINAVLCTDKSRDPQDRSYKAVAVDAQEPDKTSQTNDALSQAKTPKSGRSAMGGADDLDSDDMKNKSLFVRFKVYFKKYWYVMLPVHLVTSGMFFGAFYYLASLGLSPVPLLEHLGVPERYISHMQNTSLGYFAVALAFYKIASPLRCLTTLGLSGVTVKVLTKRGLLPSSTQVRKMVQSKVQARKTKEKRG